MILLVDIGNTRIKWGVDENGRLETGPSINYQQIDYTKILEQYWVKVVPPQLLAISSVSNHQISQQMTDLAKTIWPDVKVVIAQSQDVGFSVTNAYQHAEKLGIDRWLGLIALQHYYPGNSCIVDCGTAITIDCIDTKGQHLGGLISPGLQLMKQSLFQGTADLPFYNRQYSVGLSDTTESAIYTGVLYSAAGLIDKAINELCRCQTLVLTGGDAKLLVKYLENEAIIEADFVLKGLSLYCAGTN